MQALTDDVDAAAGWLFDPEFEDGEFDEGEEDVVLLAEIVGHGASDGVVDEGVPVDDDPDDSEESVEWSAELDDDLAARDERIEAYDRDAHHAAVREHLRQTGVADHVQEALADVATEERDTTDREGDVLDMRAITRRLAGDTTVRDYYRRRSEKPGGDLAVGVSLDMSGSMSGSELEAKAAVGAFLFAVQELGGDIVANAWHVNDGAKVRILTAPFERFRWEHLDGVQPAGGDPIAAGMWECGVMLRQTHAREKLLVVITDGRPSVVSRDKGAYDSAVEEARDTVSDLRARDLSVVGFGFGSASERNLESMFGDQYHAVGLDGLADALVEEYADHRKTR
ncbi:hypothetical protein C2R22_24560 (plasmid) [Salinigranum rubrum]|uniref:VWFA domain-containing protein n=1 Tax=Salinigranum rubrum TaxID=755307 RepID=A0A2I8VS68_9EURY|nr:hypothetical protein [Salinigranum rubrum]AUV84704.1 hypothetical protein C2R22_24560 [Salinigranum rubrum]